MTICGDDFIPFNKHIKYINLPNLIKHSTRFMSGLPTTKKIKMSLKKLLW